jgi:NADH-quinone oxidoreductase subunit L
MTRQVALVFFGPNRSRRGNEADHSHPAVAANPPPHVGGYVATNPPPHVGGYEAHESPRVMTGPLVVLAVCSILLGFLGTPAWPWFQRFLGGEAEGGFNAGVVSLMIVSSVIVFIGIGLGWWLYGRKPMEKSEEPDPLERIRPDIFALLRNKYFVDELYEATVIRFNAWASRVCDWLDAWVWNGIVQLVSYVVIGLSWVNRAFDEFAINLGFDQGCTRVRSGGGLLSRLQDGRVQNYLRWIGLALAALVLFLIWGGGK